MKPQFLMLWSGDIRGAKKATIESVESKGVVGYWRDGVLYVPDSAQVRAALPSMHRAAFDRGIHFNGLPQIWCDATNNDAPLVMRLLTPRLRPLAIYYFQPLRGSAENA
jgi:hypothetical protein